MLGTLQESAFSDLLGLATQICQAPIAAISLVDENRQWFKSIIGLNATEAPCVAAFCAHSYLKPEALLEVHDVRLDPRFASNPLVTNDPWIRFYAGAPLVTPDGLALGTLCVMDRVPRELGSEQRIALRALSRTVVTQLELRRRVAAHRRAEEVLQSLHALLQKKVEECAVELRQGMVERHAIELQLRQMSDNIPMAFWMTDPFKNKVLYISNAYELIWGRPVQSLYASPLGWLEAISSEDRQRVREATLTKQADGLYDEEYRIVRPNGDIRWVHDRVYPVRDSEGAVYRIVGVAEDITERKFAEHKIQDRQTRLNGPVEAASDTIT